MRRLGLFAAVSFLAIAVAVAVEDVFRGEDWPAWDEGWVLILFPLGIPAVLYLGLGLAGEQRRASLAAFATLSVWLWGALLFVAWLLLG